MNLKVRQIRGSRPGPHLLITGGVHGDEFEPMEAIRQLASAVRPESLRGLLSLIPIVNEAAFLRGDRVAEDGLDLARTCPGRHDGTVTERTAHALAQWIREADYYLDLHTGGTRLSVFPLAGYMLHPSAEVLECQRRMAKAFNLPVVWGTDHRLNGRSLSVARDANVPAIYCEYYGAANCRNDGTEAYVQGCWNVMAELGMVSHVRSESRVRYFVEDNREGAGHLQVCNPSPIDGFFGPCVELGEMVTTGALLGTVVSTLGDSIQPIRADRPGLVITLRTFPSVRAGDSLAVVMELQPKST